MEDLILFITSAIVDNPKDIKITTKDCENENEICYVLSVNKEDLGKVIGKKGRTIKSIRTLLNAASMKQNKRYTLEIAD